MIFTPEEGTTKESDPVSSKVIFHVLSKYLIVFVMAVWEGADSDFGLSWFEKKWTPDWHSIYQA